MRENSASLQYDWSEVLQRASFNQSFAEILHEGLSPSSSDQALALNEIVENYDPLFGSNGPLYVEKLLLEAVAVKDFVELGLSRSYPRMHRGLPRLYSRKTPSHSRIKKNFTHLPSLKKQALLKALCSLYGKTAVQGKVAVFSWIPEDDYVGAVEIARILRSRLPNVEIQFIALVHSKWAERLSFFEGAHIIPYDHDYSLEAFPEKTLSLLRSVDLILQVPTFYPYTDALMRILPNVGIECVGDYGFVESSWFHPRSGKASLGLHFLEKGIIVRKPCSSSWSDVRNEQLQKWRKAENRFYLAYLSSPIGGGIYLHALLKSLQKDEKGIDICTPDLHWFTQFVEKQNKAGKPLLEWDLGIGSIEVYFESQFYTLQLAPTGKVVRILSPDTITQGDYRALLALSGDWVAVRGSQTFSEVVSQGKAFFFDGGHQNRYLMKDLLAIAENRIGTYSHTLACLRGMGQSFLYNLPLQEGAWVDEGHFQDLDEWTAIALSLGLALEDPDTVAGFKKLNQVLTEEFSANTFLCHLVQRALCHRQNPEIGKQEAYETALFVSNSKPLSRCVESLKRMIP